MIKQIIIIDLVKPSLIQQEPHMPLKLLAVYKRLLEPLHNIFFFPG